MEWATGCRKWTPHRWFPGGFPSAIQKAGGLPGHCFALLLVQLPCYANMRRASAGVPESCGFAASHTSKQAVPHMGFLKIVVPSLAWFPLDNPLNTNQQEQIGGFPFGCPLKPQDMGVNLNKKRSQPRLSLNLVSMAGCTFPPRLPCEPHLHPDRPGSSLLSPKRPPLGGLVVFEGTLFWVAMVA